MDPELFSSLYLFIYTLFTLFIHIIAQQDDVPLNGDVTCHPHFTSSIFAFIFFHEEAIKVRLNLFLQTY